MAPAKRRKKAMRAAERKPVTGGNNTNAGAKVLPMKAAKVPPMKLGAKADGKPKNSKKDQLDLETWVKVQCKHTPLCWVRILSSKKIFWQVCKMQDSSNADTKQQN